MHGQEVIDRIIAVIINPAMLLIFSLGFLFFVFGLVTFMANPSDQTKRATGTRHMMWGIVGMFIMVAAQGIIMLLDSTFGLGVASSTSSFEGGTVQTRTINLPIFGE